MKIFIALFTFLTFQLCLIRAREEEEQNVEDQLLEVYEDFDNSDLEEDLDDFNAVELLRGKRPFCERTGRRRRTGWGGQCLDLPGLKNQSCDFIWGGDVEVKVKRRDEEICRTDELYCCVNCKAPKQVEICKEKYKVTPTWVGRDCPSGDNPLYCNLGQLDSGCKCCGQCTRTRWCRANKGYCVYEHGDEKHDYASCTDKGRRLKFSGCEGKTCQCCVP